MLVEFDKLRRDYQEHQNEIHAKLVVIMGDRLTVHCRSLQVRQFYDIRCIGFTRSRCGALYTFTLSY